MSRGGNDRWDDDSQARGARRRSRARTDEQHPSDPYGYSSPGYGSADGYAGTDDYGNAYAGDQGYGDYQQDGYADGQANGYGQNGYGQNGYGQNGYADDGYAGGQYADDGYRGGGYADDGYGGGQYADASPDPYSAPDPYGARDPYDAGDQYGGRDAYAGTDPRTSGPYGRTDSRGMTDPRSSGPYGVTDSRGMTDPRSSSGPYQGGRGGYEPAEGPAYGGRDDYSDASGYGQDDYAAQEPYGNAARYQSGGGYAGADDRYGWREAAEPVGGQDDTGQSRRSSVRAVDPDDSRHEGFFRGFGQDDEGGGGRGPRTTRKDRGDRKSHAGLIALAVVVVIFGGIAGVGYHYYSEYKQKHSSYVGSGFGTVKVFVKSGDTPDSITPELLRLQVIKEPDPWASYVANKSGLQPGEFKLHEHMSPAAAWAMLTNPKNRVSSTVTIPDGLRVTAILPKLAKESGIPLSQFETAIKNTAALGLPSWAGGNPEGFLYPDTYDIVPGDTTAMDILQEMVKQFTVETTTTVNLAAGAQAAQFTELQVITEASLLEAEVGPQYFADVARVIDNRLNQGMDLQLDSTVAYVTGKYIYNLTSTDLQTQSPYNTFLHSDLPPGPIDSPDIAAIQAVLHPAQGDWLYFVTINKQGQTDFTNSQSQFNTWSAQATANGL